MEYSEGGDTTGNCYDYVTSALGIPEFFHPTDEKLADNFTTTDSPDTADAVGVRKIYRDGGSGYTHMGLVRISGTEVVIDHVPNVGQSLERNVNLEDFRNTYEQDGGQIVFFRLKE